MCSMDGTWGQIDTWSRQEEWVQSWGAGQHCLPSSSTKSRVHYCMWQRAEWGWSLWRGEARAVGELAKSRVNSRGRGMPVWRLTFYIQTKEKVKRWPWVCDLGSLLGELGKTDHSLEGGQMNVSNHLNWHSTQSFIKTDSRVTWALRDLRVT